MKPVADVVNAISGVINGLTLPAREKKELQAEILRLVYEREREMIEARAGVIRAEAAGNWLQRSWRPLVMLIFAVIVLICGIFLLEYLSYFFCLFSRFFISFCLGSCFLRFLFRQIPPD